MKNEAITFHSGTDSQPILDPSGPGLLRSRAPQDSHGWDLIALESYKVLLVSSTLWRH